MAFSVRTLTRSREMWFGRPRSSVLNLYLFIKLVYEFILLKRTSPVHRKYIRKTSLEYSAVYTKNSFECKKKSYFTYNTNDVYVVCVMYLSEFFFESPTRLNGLKTYGLSPFSRRPPQTFYGSEPRIRRYVSPVNHKTVQNTSFADTDL